MIFKGVIIVAGIVFGIMVAVFLVSGYSKDMVDQTQSDKKEVKVTSIARQFIKSSPTFSYDGIDESLDLKLTNTSSTLEQFTVTGRFNTQHNGYGDRSNLDLPEETTAHTIDVVIIDDKIVPAVIDNR